MILKLYEYECELHFKACSVLSKNFKKYFWNNLEESTLFKCFPPLSYFRLVTAPPVSDFGSITFFFLFSVYFFNFKYWRNRQNSCFNILSCNYFRQVVNLCSAAVDKGYCTRCVTLILVCSCLIARIEFFHIWLETKWTMNVNFELSICKTKLFQAQLTDFIQICRHNTICQVQHSNIDSRQDVWGEVGRWCYTS